MAVYIRSRLTGARVQRAPLMRLAQRILSAVGESAAELSIELIGDRRMRRLNHDYRKKDRTTDVLAFAMRESFIPYASSRTPAMLGDVVISIPTAVRQAREAGRTLDEEIAALLVHGVLHLCGYDHERSEKDAARMHRRERIILKKVQPVPRLVITRSGPRKRNH